MQLNAYFFLLTQYTALKVLFQQRRTWTSIFFFHCLDSEKRTLGARHDKMINNNIFNVFKQDAGVFLASLAHPRNTWTDLWLGMAQDVTIKSSSCQDSPDYFTCSYFFDEFLQEVPESEHWIDRDIVVRAEGKTRYVKSELFQNLSCHFSQFQIRCNVEDSAKMHSTTIWMCRKWQENGGITKFKPSCVSIMKRHTLGFWQE